MAALVWKFAPLRGSAIFFRSTREGSFSARAARGLRNTLISLVLALATVVAVEWIASGSFINVQDFLLSPIRPGLTTVGVLLLVMLLLDALSGRAHLSALALAPVAAVPAFVSSQKQLYLPDPLYPSDFLFTGQILQLMPVIVGDRQWFSTMVVIGVVTILAGLVFLWRYAWRHFPRLTWRARVTRLLICLPILAAFISLVSDYSQYSWLRDRLQVVPIMWDQKENYRQNGFIMAFSLNLPMAHVTAPSGFNSEAIDAIPARSYGYLAGPDEKPDVIMLMSESLWDPTRLATIKLTPDPMPTIRALQSGNVFSPEFGGMTANVEFEALTGFSNAFLPYGSIPYQQYIRHSLPSLATFFRGEGYAARSIHPFTGWFWNRSEVYKEFGFDEFRTEENMPPMEKRGIFTSDDALMKEIMREGDDLDQPFFFFAVTLQGHGPYEPNRYAHNTVAIEGNLMDGDREALATYTQGVKEADESLKMLIDWASGRERETIVVLWGDHLPPLGNIYTDTGYMPEQVATRKAPLDVMKREHETPLVIWSSRKGTRRDVGTISPALLPYHVLKFAGYEHPFYTGFLGRVQKKYAIIDRYQLAARDDSTSPGWILHEKNLDPLVKDYRYLQYDIMFGKQRAMERFFPSHYWLTGSGS